MPFKEWPGRTHEYKQERQPDETTKGVGEASSNLASQSMLKDAIFQLLKESAS